MGNVPLTIRYGCIFGPSVQRIHTSRELQPALPASGRNYQPTALEHNAQSILNIIYTAKTLLYYTFPVWSVMLFRRGYITLEYGSTFLKYSVIFSCFYFGLILLRGIGRMNNQDYLDFYSDLDNSKRGSDKKRMYDFDFKEWPVDYEWKDSTGDETKKQITPPPFDIKGRFQKLKESGSGAASVPAELLSYVIAHGFGLSMVYPGSTYILNAIIRQALQDGRNKLVENNKGIRAKLKTSDGNFIDTMFVDQRSDERDDPSAASQTLVVCCEGNAGFYEVGTMVTPIEGGYCVLGWNHPGFASSTGVPSPEAEINAIDAVMQYAIHKLGFCPENIVVFGWSIGAFTAINAAVMYPEIRSLIIDATFDDIMPLAAKAMPQALGGIVERTIRSYINLNHGELIKDYPGPVHFIRRNMDEVMNLEGQHNVSSNCGNPLLHHFLMQRYPLLFEGTEEEKMTIKDALDIMLSKQDDVAMLSVMSSYDVDDKHCEILLKSYIDQHSSDFPVEIGRALGTDVKIQLVLYLARKHLGIFHSSHCTPLPRALFVKPWDIRKDLEDSYMSQCSGSSDEFEIVNGPNGK